MTDTQGNSSFPKACRLSGPQAYAAVLTFKCRVGGELFQIHVRPNGSPTSRLGLIVSKRIVPTAVARNYCKRLVREVFRVEHRALSGMDIVVRARAKVTPAMSSVAWAEIHDLLRRALEQCRRRKTA